jgi:hypothetical protein
MGFAAKQPGEMWKNAAGAPQAGSISKRIRQSRSGIDHTLSSPSSSNGSKIASLALEGGVGGLGGTLLAVDQGVGSQAPGPCC